MIIEWGSHQKLSSFHFEKLIDGEKILSLLILDINFLSKSFLLLRFMFVHFFL